MMLEFAACSSGQHRRAQFLAATTWSPRMVSHRLLLLHSPAVSEAGSAAGVPTVSCPAKQSRASSRLRSSSMRNGGGRALLQRLRQHAL